ncbi:MAG: hypothetical protein KBF30_11950 [Hyphomonadaceae bacterium]|nr:hypothetical protein [Hyphomonadaceae bacterium]
MTLSRLTLTRRAALRMGATALGGLMLTPAARAQRVVQWPLRLAYARMSPDGFVAIRGDEQSTWQAMQTRLGGLIDAIQPLQPANMMGVSAPKIDGAASCAMVARQMAVAAGFDYVILYATNDGQRIYKSEGNWFSDMFASLQADLDKDDRATGEAHLLDVAGGAPLTTVTADARPRDPLNLFDGGRNPERETLMGLTQGIERRLQDMARAAYDAQRSIAD